MHDPYANLICSCLKLLYCNVVGSCCFPLFRFSYGMQHLPRPPLDPVCSRSSSFRQCSPSTLHLYFTWIIVQFVEIFFPPFSHLCWFGENAAVFSFNRP